jgi:Arc/MetJ-type ribon-helix-helix transcriptional regulator
MKEKDMSEPLPLDQFVARQLASGRYPSYDALVEDALRLLQERDAGADHDETHHNGEEDVLPQDLPTHKHIWDIAEELFGVIPDEELARLPHDGAAQIDHYVYGLPKRPA